MLSIVTGLGDWIGAIAIQGIFDVPKGSDWDE
jgi:hypothetical protein